MAVPAWLAKIGSYVGGQLLGHAKRLGSGFISSILSLGMMWAVHGVYKFAPYQGLQMAEWISNTYYRMPVEWAGFVTSYLRNMTGREIPIEAITKARPGGVSTVAGQELGKVFFDPMMDALGIGQATPGRPLKLTPESGIRNAQRFLSINLQFQMSAWLLHLLGDWQSFGAFKSLKDLPNAISWSYGIGWLSWLVMGVPFRMGISEPMERYYNMAFRPTKPTYSKLIDLWKAGKLKDRDLARELAELGYSDEWYFKLMELERAELTKGDIESLYKAGIYGRDDAYSALGDARVHEFDREPLITLWDKEKLDKLLERVVGKAKDLYVKGYMSENDIRMYLGKAGYTTDEQDLILIELELEREEKRLDVQLNPFSISVIGRLYRERHIDLRRAIELMQRQNFTRKDAELYLRLYSPE